MNDFFPLVDRSCLFFDGLYKNCHSKTPAPLVRPVSSASELSLRLSGGSFLLGRRLGFGRRGEGDGSISTFSAWLKATRVRELGVPPEPGVPGVPGVPMSPREAGRLSSTATRVRFPDEGRVGVVTPGLAFFGFFFFLYSACRK